MDILCPLKAILYPNSWLGNPVGPSWIEEREGYRTFPGRGGPIQKNNLKITFGCGILRIFEKFF
jgi:hypothetical protein